MTDIEQRANESVLKYVHEEYNSEYKLGFYNGYSCGATEQKKIDIEKAWKIMTGIVMPSNLEQFKQIMEE